MMTEIQFREGSLDFPFRQVVPALRQQLEIVFTSLVALVTDGDYHLQDIFVEERPLFEDF